MGGPGEECLIEVPRVSWDICKVTRGVESRNRSSVLAEESEDEDGDIGGGAGFVPPSLTGKVSDKAKKMRFRKVAREE